MAPGNVLFARCYSVTVFGGGVLPWPKKKTREGVTEVYN